VSLSDEGALYAPVAEQQLDALQVDPDELLYNAVLDAIDHILDLADDARAKSPPLRDNEGRTILSTVVMYEADPRWFVFWRMGDTDPVILGVAPLPQTHPGVSRI
jgi:hypothetical protein